jgi:hypothetical protein
LFPLFGEGPHIKVSANTPGHQIVIKVWLPKKHRLPITNIDQMNGVSASTMSGSFVTNGVANAAKAADDVEAWAIIIFLPMQS